MTTCRGGRWAIAVAGAALTLAWTPAFAQSPSQAGTQRRSWFGGGAGRADQSLTAMLSIDGGLFRSREPGRDAGGEEAVRDSRVGFLAATVDYRVSGRRAGVSADWGSTTNYYSSVPGQALVGHRADVAAWWQVARPTRLSVSQTASYEPALLRLFQAATDIGLSLPGGGSVLPAAGAAIPGGGSAASGSRPGAIGAAPSLSAGELGAVDDFALAYGTTVSLNHEVTRRSALSAGYGHRRTDFGGSARMQVFDSADAGFTYQITQGLGLRLGYGYVRHRLTELPDRARPERHRVDAGVDFNRALSLSRRTTLAFSTGSDIVRSSDRTRFFLTGSAQLNHRMGRTWDAGLSFARSVDFIDGITEPVVRDRASASLAGNLSRRVKLSTTASAAGGRIGAGESENRYRNLQGSAGLSVALSRSAGFGGTYSYARAGFDRDDFLLSSAFRELTRHAVGASVNLWAVALNVNYADGRYDLDSGVPDVSAVQSFNGLSAAASVGLGPYLALGVTWSNYRTASAADGAAPLAKALRRLNGQSLLASFRLTAPFFHRVRK